MASHGGNLKKRQELNKRNGSRSKTHSGYSYRVYCSMCTPEKQSNSPENDVHMTVAAGQKIAVCPNGHRVQVVA
jgi:hypothetical protein